MNAMIQTLAGVDSALQGARSLATLARDSAVTGVARQGLFLDLTSLPRGDARAEGVQRARDAVEPLLDGNRAQLFQLPDASLVVVWRSLPAGLLERVGRVLAETPLDRMRETATLADVATVLHLPRDARKLADRIEASLRPAEDEAEQRALAPLHLADLARIERAVAHADLIGFLRRQPIYSLVGDGFEQAWERRELSVDAIIAHLHHGYDAGADPWLFRRLTRLLDTRLLSLLVTPEQLRSSRSISINVTVEALLSPEFLHFDAMLPARLRGAVVLDLDALDILQDPSAFNFARAFVRGRAYRVCLRGMTELLLPVLNLPALELDYVQIRHSPGLVQAPELVEAAQASGAAVVLSRVDSHASLSWGRFRGITLFRGRVFSQRRAPPG